jgi:hypothetical protein
MSPVICPRCGHRPGPADRDTHPGVCPACGIAWAKWRARAAGEAPSDTPYTERPATEPEDSLGTRLRAQLLLAPEGLDNTGLAARALLLLALGAWTLWFAAHGINWEIIGGSFLHRANLAFHEFGHLFFMPFGETMTILGGSLFQVLLPVALAGYFAWWQQDNFAAAAASWWAGQNLVDLAPYIRDAEYRALPLVGGRGEESHDWGNLLEHWNAVAQCHALARGSFTLGLLLMVAALAWGGSLLWRAQRNA